MPIDQRFHELLALVLLEETSYKQPHGGPYVRKIVRGNDGIRRGAVFNPERGCLEVARGVLLPLPEKPDGLAFDDDPHDTGGRTSMGILQREYHAYRRERGLPQQDVWRIEDHEIEEIMHAQYWLPMQISRLPPGIDYAVLDFGFNCGIGKAAEKLQRVLGVKVDRHIGLNTIYAAKRADPRELIEELSREREAYHRACKTFWRHGENWLARTARVKQRALGMIETAPNVVAVAAVAPPQEVPTPPAGTARENGAETTAIDKAAVVNVAGQTGAGLMILSQVNTAARETRDSGLFDLAANLLTSPMFVATLVVSISLAVIFRDDTDPDQYLHIMLRLEVVQPVTRPT